MFKYAFVSQAIMASSKTIKHYLILSWFKNHWIWDQGIQCKPAELH